MTVWSALRTCELLAIALRSRANRKLTLSQNHEVRHSASSSSALCRIRVLRYPPPQWILAHEIQCPGLPCSGRYLGTNSVPRRPVESACMRLYPPFAPAIWTIEAPRPAQQTCSLDAKALALSSASSIPDVSPTRCLSPPAPRTTQDADSSRARERSFLPPRECGGHWPKRPDECQ